MAAGRDTLTVVFTDIEASTAMRNRLGDDLADEVVALHDDVVVKCAGEHDGRVVKHTGDGAMICFRSPRSAIECTVAIQRALAALTDEQSAVPAVRIGVNAGEVAVADDGDLFGQAVNAAARVAAHGQGGDIIVSDVVRGLVGHQPGLEMVDIGSHDLAGFGEPWHLHAVSWRPPTDREIQLLGEVRVSVDGQRIENDASPRALLVLAALVLERGRPVDRGQLAFRLWPESSDGQARTNLRKVLHELRAWLPDDEWLEVDQRRIRLRTEAVRVDVEEFHSAVEADDDRTAAALYAGPLLPGSWDDWVLDERGELEALAIHSLHRHLADLADPQERIQTAQRLLVLDRADEHAHRALIQAYDQAGNRAAALRAFHTCATVLERDVGVAPGPATVAAYEAARTSAASPPADHSVGVARRPSGRRAGPPLLGRDEELRWLHDLWQAAVGGDRAAALVAGESGIGKSRLIDEFASRREREGAVVLRSRAYEADGGRTLAPIVDWLRHSTVERMIATLPTHHRAELGRLLPEHQTADPDRPRDPTDVRALLFDAAADALARAGAPLLLVLDDLQWCGPDTIDFVGHLLHRGPATQMLIAATRRDHEQSADPALDRRLADLRAESLLVDRRLGVLRPVDTAAVARAATDIEWSEPEVARLHTETDGHPLFVIEAARAGPGADHITPTVAGLIERRLVPLTDDQRALLDVAAVFGRRFGPDQLAVAARRDEEEAIDAVDELWRLGLLVQVGQEFDFAHDQFRDVVLAAISPARRTLLHRHVAGALVDTAGGATAAIADRLAEHYERSAMIDEAIDALAEAGGQAKSIGAHGQAIRHIEHALHLLAERPAGAERDERELRLLTDLASAFVVQTGYGSPEAQRTWAAAAAISTRLGTTLPGPVLRGMALAEISDCEFVRSGERGEALCGLDDPVARVEGHYVLGVTRFWQGRFAEAEQHLLEVLHTYDPSASAQHRALYGQDPQPVCGCRLAYLWVLQGRAREADALMDQVQAQVEALDDALTSWYVWAYWLFIDAYLGRPTRIRAPVVPAQGFFNTIGEEGSLMDRPLDWADDDQESLEAVVDSWRQDGHRLHLTIWLAKAADFHAERGETERALEYLDEAESRTSEWGQRYLASDLLRRRAALLRSVADPTCAGVAASAVEQAEALGAASLVLRARTELLRCTGDPATAARLRTEVEALADAHYGIDMDQARAALDDVVTDVTDA